MYREDWVKPGRLLDREMALRVALTLLRVAEQSGSWQSPAALWALEHVTQELKAVLPWDDVRTRVTGKAASAYIADWLQAGQFVIYFPKTLDFVQDVQRARALLVRGLEETLREAVEIHKQTKRKVKVTEWWQW